MLIAECVYDNEIMQLYGSSNETAQQQFFFLVTITIPLWINSEGMCWVWYNNLEADSRQMICHSIQHIYLLFPGTMQQQKWLLLDTSLCRCLMLPGKLHLLSYWFSISCSMRTLKNSCGPFSAAASTQLLSGNILSQRVHIFGWFYVVVNTTVYIIVWILVHCCDVIDLYWMVALHLKLNCTYHFIT